MTHTAASDNSNNNNNDVDPIPAIAHAIGGSLGSALALLLLYPLERSK